MQPFTRRPCIKMDVPCTSSDQMTAYILRRDSVASVLMVVYCVRSFIPESARWLVSQGRDEEATQILELMARVNNRQLPHPLNLQDNRRKQVPHVTYLLTIIYVSCNCI